MLVSPASFQDFRTPYAGHRPRVSEDPLATTGYRTVSWVGQGGMSEVFVAEHLELGSTVVVKLLRSALADRADLAERMRVEGQALAQLSHPNIVQVIDAGRTLSGRPFLVMERLVGRTLGAELRARGALPRAEALLIIHSVLAGLAAAHALGIVHRDVKVENIFLHVRHDGSRIAKILDFGVAKILEGEKRAMPEPLSVPTEHGLLVGTPGYLSPEQLLGRPADPRSDLYSVAIVLYKLLTGSGPFDAHGRGDRQIEAHVKELPRPPSWYAKQRIGARLDAVVLRALRKDPDQRYQSAAEFAQALEAAEHAPGPARTSAAFVARGSAPPPAAASVWSKAPLGGFSSSAGAIIVLAILAGITGGVVSALAASVMARMLG